MCLNVKRVYDKPTFPVKPVMIGSRYRGETRIGTLVYHYEFKLVQCGVRVVCLRTFLNVSEDGIPGFLANFLNKNRPMLDLPQVNISEEELCHEDYLPGENKKTS